LTTSKSKIGRGACHSDPRPVASQRLCSGTLRFISTQISGRVASPSLHNHPFANTPQSITQSLNNQPSSIAPGLLHSRLRGTQSRSKLRGVQPEPPPSLSIPVFIGLTTSSLLPVHLRLAPKWVSASPRPGPVCPLRLPGFGFARLPGCAASSSKQQTLPPSPPSTRGSIPLPSLVLALSSPPGCLHCPLLKRQVCAARVSSTARCPFRGRPAASVPRSTSRHTEPRRRLPSS
jgi:hypothetical protein